MKISNRVGRFYFDRDVVFYDERMYPAIMHKCRIFRAEHLLANDKVEYYALCDLFEDIEPGGLIPEYVWQIDGDGALTVERVE